MRRRLNPNWALIFILVLNLAFWGVVIYVVHHFIAKFW